jgi:hypothetical protein
MISGHIFSCLKRAESHYRSGDYEAALATLDTLPEIDRVEPPVVSMEARLCIAAGEWERGLKRAYMCEFADGDEYGIASAEFYHAYAVYLCGKGEIERAKFYIEAAAGLFPAIRQEMAENPALSGFFGGG